MVRGFDGELKLKHVAQDCIFISLLAVNLLIMDAFTFVCR